MPAHIFTVVARGHAIDSQTNTLTLFSVVEQLGGPALPLRAAELYVVTLWARLPGEEDAQFAQRLLIKGPGGNELVHFELSFRLDKPRVRAVAGIEGLPILQTGLYHIEIFVRRVECAEWGEPVARYPIEVSVGSTAGPRQLFDQPPPA